jgi:hypothetical protein
MSTLSEQAWASLGSRGEDLLYEVEVKVKVKAVAVLGPAKPTLLGSSPDPLEDLVWESLHTLDRRLLPFGYRLRPVPGHRCPVPGRHCPLPGRRPTVTRRLLPFGGCLRPVLGSGRPVLGRQCPVLGRGDPVLGGQHPLSCRDLPIDERLLNGNPLAGTAGARRHQVPLGRHPIPRRRPQVPLGRGPIPRRRHQVPPAAGEPPVDRCLVPLVGNLVTHVRLGVALLGFLVTLIGEVVAAGRSLVGGLFTVRGRSGRWHRVYLLVASRLSGSASSATIPPGAPSPGPSIGQRPQLTLGAPIASEGLRRVGGR